MHAVAAAPPTKAERTRAAILAAAGPIFARRGFAGTRLDDIGAELGIAGSGILYHFRGKRALYQAVLEGLLDDLAEAMESALARGGLVAERFESLVSAGVRFAVRRPELAHLVMREATSDDEDLQGVLQERTQSFLGLVHALYAEGERTGELRPICDDPTHLVSAVGGTIIFYIAALPSFVPDLPASRLDEADVQALEHDVLQIARRLLGIPGRRARRRKEKSV